MWRIQTRSDRINVSFYKISMDVSPADVLLIAAKAGIPGGVFNVVPGVGPTAGKAIGMHNDFDCAALTGSGHVGEMFRE